MLALLVGLTVFGAVFALAASLGVNGGAIQAGADTELRCDTNGVQVLGWGLETDTGMVSFVRIGDISPTCAGNDMWVRITKDGSLIAKGSLTLDGSGSAKISFTPQAAVDITDIQVYIEGPNGA
jgi:hypothetical protein